MTQEQKDLLLKDLCARLPYGVKAYVKNWSKLDCKYYEGVYTVKSTFPSLNEVHVQSKSGSVNVLLGQSDYVIKPYLFPLSSMTDEQCEELNNLIHEHFILDDGFNEGISFKTYGDILVWLDEKPINQCYFIFDYFNKNHLDYRELIPMSLALDATGLNIY